jgi:tRNA U34 5-methylaminomethyl-2-thiouridine-forming methyltransferase MnmC
MYTPPTDFLPLRTADGSFTLRSAQLGEQYHSVHGAVQESRHVFLEAGLFATSRSEVDVLEVGLGTGLNALLTALETRAGDRIVRYTALEPFPLEHTAIAALDHPALCGHPEERAAFEAFMTAAPGTCTTVHPRFGFRQLPLSVLELDLEDTFDLVYYDAFGPATQPELWTAEAFRRVARAMRPGAILVTYCAKGDVRRAMLAEGLTTERLPGPPGKREMLRATRPL